MVRKIEGTSWNDTCSAEGWPLPTVEWYYLDQAIKIANNFTAARVVNHHRHLVSYSYLIIANLSQADTGNFTCVVNGNLKIKKVLLLIDSTSSKDETNPGKIKYLQFWNFLNINKICFISRH